MAYRKTLVNRLVNNLRNTRLHAGGDCRSSTESAATGKFVLHSRDMNATSVCAWPPELLLSGVLREKLMLAGVNRLRVECLFPPPPAPTFKLSAENARRIVRMSMVKQLAMKLREEKENSISYEEFVRICVEGSGSDDQGSEMAKALNESGEVFVVGNIVFLRPEQVTKSVHALIAQTLPKPDNTRRQQLENMEKQKAEIDSLARTQVRSELFCGLGLLLAQTIAAMKLTFWDLSWDVMEPVCFFAVSMHFIAAYTFFLRTSTEPTFEGYFQRRLLTKQRKLMLARNFDFDKYEELRWALYGPSREMGMAAQYRPNDIL